MNVICLAFVVAFNIILLLSLINGKYSYLLTQRKKRREKQVKRIFLSLSTYIIGNKSAYKRLSSVPLAEEEKERRCIKDNKYNGMKVKANTICYTDLIALAKKTKKNTFVKCQRKQNK